ncbi:MAG: hypothetical protein OXI01_04200 [Albidovulum sp.]|nr:hypothetical protein [Albidovulum sp.]
MVDQRDIERAKVICISDTGRLQGLRGAYRSCAKNSLALDVIINVTNGPFGINPCRAIV